VNASSRKLFYKLLWGFGSFILFLVFVYWFLSGGSLESLVGPHFVYFVSLILSFLSFLISVNFAFEVIVDLKKSLEEKSPWTAQIDLLFLPVFLALIAVSSILFLRSFVRLMAHHLHQL
jgi:hypothetical protein